MFIMSGFNGGANAIAFTPTAVNDINYIKIENGLYDDLMITKDTSYEIKDYIPDWSYDTVLYAKFNNTTNASNIDWDIKNTEAILVKSRPVGQFQWKTVVVQETSGVDDFEINYIDYTVPSGQPTEYALVPVTNGLEGAYFSTTVTPVYTKLFVIELNTVYGSELIDNGVQITRNIPSANVELLNSRYPVFVRNTIANYDTGSLTGIWIPVVSEEGCDQAEALDSEYDYERTEWQVGFVDFLADSKPKIIKDDVGHIWAAQITPNITDEPQTSNADRKITFTFVEVGSTKSAEDLYYLGLSDVGPEWWSN